MSPAISAATFFDINSCLRGEREAAARFLTHRMCSIGASRSSRVSSLLPVKFLQHKVKAGQEGRRNT
jgi:hypothetical protein